MKTLKNLVREATESAKNREHRLQWSYDEKRGVAYGHCAYCDCPAHCKVNPMPNETNISGDAVAINCGS